MPESLAVQEKFIDYAEITPDSQSLDLPEDAPVSLDSRAHSEADIEELLGCRALLWTEFKNIGAVARCDLVKNLSGLWGMDKLESLGADQKKYLLYETRAGYLIRAVGFDDTEELREACERFSRPLELGRDFEGDPSLEEYREKRFEILLKTGFPQEYLWMTKCKPRKAFDKRWNGKATKALRAKPYVLYLNSGDILLKTFGFSNPREFINACEKLTEYAKARLPSCIESAIDDLAVDLPREWKHLPDKISGESWFAGVAYLGDKVREVLYSDEILYIILKIQERVKDCGAIEAVQRFEADDGTKVICADTMKGKTDGWKMIVSQ